MVSAGYTDAGTGGGLNILAMEKKNLIKKISIKKYNLAANANLFNIKNRHWNLLLVFFL